MKYFSIFLILFSLKSVAQPPQQDFTNSFVQSSKSWIDVDYVSDNIIGHKLDIHLPTKGKTPFPIVVAVYGSAFFSNSSKAAIFRDGFGQFLLDNGFAVVCVNHRASTETIFPAQAQDIKAAIRFVRANALKFDLNAGIIGITGYSSGGHLSAFTGTTNETKTFKLNDLDIDIEGNLGKFTSTSSKVSAVVDWFGPTDFLVMDKCGSTLNHDDAKSPESTLVGCSIQEHKGKVALANPINYVNKNNPPFLVFHGDKDPLVPHCQSELLYEKLQKLDVKSELTIIKGGLHGPGVMIPENYKRMIAFFNSNLKNVKN